MEDLHAVMTGVYASPVGALNTHLNAVADGEAVGQIATTIARPDYGYGGTCTLGGGWGRGELAEAATAKGCRS